MQREGEIAGSRGKLGVGRGRGSWLCAVGHHKNIMAKSKERKKYKEKAKQCRRGCCCCCCNWWNFSKELQGSCEKGEWQEGNTAAATTSTSSLRRVRACVFVTLTGNMREFDELPSLSVSLSPYPALYLPMPQPLPLPMLLPPPTPYSLPYATACDVAFGWV